MTAEEIRQRFEELGVWRRGDRRAPHKPLLLLYMLGRYQRGASRLVAYEDIDADLRPLLLQYSNSSHTEYPFWHLQTDEIWEVRKADAARVREGKASQPPKGELLRLGAEGGLLPGVYDAVTKDPALARDLALGLLAAHFPETLHEEILEQVGFDTAVAAAARRDPRFREAVLMAYEYRCALCDFEARIDGALVGVEAAHVKWHQARGPSTVDNGISFCSLHHKLFDRGAFTLDDERRVVLSRRLTSSEPTRSAFEAQHGRPVRLPREELEHPRLEYVQWHREEVFQGPGRAVS
jgi:putative restriction endonuclease